MNFSQTYPKTAEALRCLDNNHHLVYIAPEVLERFPELDYYACNSADYFEMYIDAAGRAWISANGLDFLDFEVHGEEASHE